MTFNIRVYYEIATSNKGHMMTNIELSTYLNDDASDQFIERGVVR